KPPEIPIEIPMAGLSPPTVKKLARRVRSYRSSRRQQRTPAWGMKFVRRMTPASGRASDQTTQPAEPEPANVIAPQHAAEPDPSPRCRRTRLRDGGHATALAFD